LVYKFVPKLVTTVTNYFLSLKLIIIQKISCSLLQLHELDISLIISIKYPKVSYANMCRTWIHDSDWSIGHHRFLLNLLSFFYYL